MKIKKFNELNEAKYDYLPIDEFKEKAENLLSQLEDLVLQMPDKGDKCETSQKICLIQAINEVYANISGTSQEDLVK